MTWGEMVGWRAFYEIEPFGERRADLRIGHAIARLATYLGGKDVRVADFIATGVQEDGPEPEPAPKPTFEDVRGALFQNMGLEAPERVKGVSAGD